MVTQLDGKAVLITGAASGIGADLALRLAEQGARLALIDRDTEALQVVGLKLGGRHVCINADVTDEAAMSDAVARATESLGELDVVVANAGVLGTPTPTPAVSTVDFRHILDVNVLGVHNTIRPALASVTKQRGSIVVVASVAALLPTPFIAPYVASKHAVEGYARSLRIELSATGVHVGIAYFGVIDTPMAHRAAGDDLGGAALHIIPGPAGKPISVSHASTAIIRNITRRRTTTVAPSWLGAVMATRGLSAPADRRLHHIPAFRDLLKRAGQRP